MVQSFLDFLFQLHIEHFNQLHGYRIGTVDSLVTYVIRSHMKLRCSSTVVK